MIVIVDVNEHLGQDGRMYVRNVDTAIEEIFHNDIDGIVLTRSVAEPETARLKAIVQTLGKDIIVVQTTSHIDDAVKEIEERLRLERLRNVTFSDPLAPENLADQITVV